MTQSRRMLVLRAVVEDYIRSQEPVGSTTLTKDHDLGVSSATVRNDMAALEDEGYLIQPHTSAGRIPTEKGYRYFVDRLATVVPMSEAQRRGINSFCRDPSICRTPCSAQPVFWRKSPVRSRSWRHRRWRNRRYGISKSFPYQSTPCWPSSSPTPAEWRSICSTFPSCRTPRCCRIWSTKSTRSAPAFL